MWRCTTCRTHEMISYIDLTDARTQLAAQSKAQCVIHTTKTRVFHPYYYDTCTRSIHNPFPNTYTRYSNQMLLLGRLVALLLVFHIHSPTLNGQVETPAGTLQSTRKLATNALQHVNKLCPEPVDTAVDAAYPFGAV